MSMKSTFTNRCRVKAIVSALLVLMSVQILTACIPIMVAGVTVTAINVATDRRSLGRNIDDNTLELNLRKDYLFDTQLQGTNISVTAINGIVLLTGEVATDSQRRYAEQIARQRESAIEVVNELALAGTTSATSRANDTIITSKVKAKLLHSKDVQANSIKVVTEAGKVYLLGIVTPAEAEAAVAATRTVSGITHIVKVFSIIK